LIGGYNDYVVCLSVKVGCCLVSTMTTWCVCLLRSAVDWWLQ